MALDPTYSDELARERQALVKAEQDIVAGEERLFRQGQRVLELRLKGDDGARAEKLQATLNTTLTEWVRHRDMIRQRIEYLERKLAPPDTEPAAPSPPPD